jgi:predicted metal-binding protein
LKDIVFEAADAAGLSIHEWAIMETGKLVFSPLLLDYCKANACGMYNKSWTCPPACDSFEQQKKKILSHKNAFVFTTVHKIEDSFDFEGMTDGKELHARLLLELRNRLKDIPIYGAGSCPVCKSCVFPDPCPFPGKKTGSIEAAGINVTELSKAAGLSYNNGVNTVTYFSMVLM